MQNLTPIHIGLVGHIDHGKTELARALSEKVSTAGLDKHPQAQERGITIDLGFTMFRLDAYLITLVDAPGHADLIRSVVAGAGIIDAAILVVAADEGPKIQTGEHTVVLHAMGIDTIIVAITKTDLVDEVSVTNLEANLQSLLEDVGFRTLEFVKVSVKNGRGIDELKSIIRKKVRPRPRDVDGPVMIPIDHAFPVKGHGTVVTGTILRGKISIGDELDLIPQGKSAKVRAIQTFGKERTNAAAGDRIGLNIPEIKHQEIPRGSYLSAPNRMIRSNKVAIQVRMNPLYKGRLAPEMVLNATIGMPTITARIIPFKDHEGNRIICEPEGEREIQALLFLNDMAGVEIGMPVLLHRSDLPPSHMRIVGSGMIVDDSPSFTLFTEKIRVGHVSRIRDNDVLIEGLATSNKRAKTLLGKQVITTDGIRGNVLKSFGTRGVLSAMFESEVAEGTEVELRILKEKI